MVSVGLVGPISTTYDANASAPSSCRSPSVVRSTTIGSVLVGGASTVAAISLVTSGEGLSVSRTRHEATMVVCRVATAGLIGVRNERPCLFFAPRSFSDSPTAIVVGIGVARPFVAIIMLATTSHGPGVAGLPNGHAMDVVTRLLDAIGLTIFTIFGLAAVRVDVVATSRSGRASKGRMVAIIMAKSIGVLAMGGPMCANRLPL